jgi:hypothetical protein
MQLYWLLNKEPNKTGLLARPAADIQQALSGKIGTPQPELPHEPLPLPFILVPAGRRIARERRRTIIVNLQNALLDSFEAGIQWHLRGVIRWPLSWLERRWTARGPEYFDIAHQAGG